MLRTIFSFIPFTVCLFWLAAFALRFHRNDRAKRWLTGFLATCVVLYLCHGLFFTVGLSREMECIWTLCSMSVYPLYFIYICQLTNRSLSLRNILLILAPGALVALAKYVLPMEGPEMARRVLFAVQVLMVCWLGFRKLKAFDREVAEVYADTEGRDTYSVRWLLVAFVATSFFSMVANALGKQFFAGSEWTLLIVLTPFSVMLYMLSYIGYNRSFTVEQFVVDSAEAVQEPACHDAVSQDVEGQDASTPAEEDGDKEAADTLDARIEQLMTERKLYLVKNLKIGDVALEAKSCRTYVSNYINRTSGMSFSDYVNQRRVEHAKRLLLRTDSDAKVSAIADESGFASEQSFYRNFHKFTGMNPLEWKRQEREQQARG